MHVSCCEHLTGAFLVCMWKLTVVFVIVLTADVNEHDAGNGDAGMNGCGDADVLPSNASSRLNLLMNLQRSPQVSQIHALYGYFHSFVINGIISNHHHQPWTRCPVESDASRIIWLHLVLSCLELLSCCAPIYRHQPILWLLLHSLVIQSTFRRCAILLLLLATKTNNLICWLSLVFHICPK